MNIPPEFIELLKTREIVGEEDLRSFLFPNLAELPHPEIMQNLSVAAKLIAKHMIERKPLFIWGDYDVDGSTGTALLINFFRECGVEVQWHIPNRLKEGYGLNADWLSDKKNIDFSDNLLLITVDCGISNFQEVKLVNQLGGKVIITDHHSLPKQQLPDCLILNPAQQTCGFRGHHLAGVGVAFYLAAGIRKELLSHPDYFQSITELNLKKYLAFVALGTIADVVELTPTNRILVRAGLEALLETPFIGLQELLLSCEISAKYITSEDIGYLLGPKINAAGRLGESEIVIELLTARDTKLARRLSKRLSQLNIERKKLSESNLETTLDMLSNSMLNEHKCVVVGGDFHQGVAGIVASRLVEKFQVPAIVFAKRIDTQTGDVFIGSARSVEGINIVESIAECQEWIERFGGHEMAAGLNVKAQNFEEFRKCFMIVMKEKMVQRQVSAKRNYDIMISAESMMTEDYLKFFQLLEPFGPGNQLPVLKDPSATILDARVVGKDCEHLQVTIRGKYSNLKGIGFNMGHCLSDIQNKPKRSMLFTPTMNRYRGTINWQVRVIDI